MTRHDFDGIHEKSLLKEGWSLHERLRYASAKPINWGINNSSSSAKDNLEQWQAVVAPDAAENFNSRIAWDNLTTGKLNWALDPDDCEIPLNPSWWDELKNIRNAALEYSQSDQKYTQQNHRCREQPFVHAWRPISASALADLQKCCRDFDQRLIISEHAWLSLSDSLLTRLCNSTEQVMWYLFNENRSPGNILLAHLGKDGDGTGEPTNEYYNQFVRDLLNGGYAELLLDFPVLGRILATIVRLWRQGSEEMLRRILSSLYEIQETFDLANPNSLDNIQLELSDPHCGGRAVAILSFGDQKVVYKPKNMGVDKAYQTYLEIINNASQMTPLKHLKILAKDDYGFMEWVEHRPCTNTEELKRFYVNAGRLMGVLYLLGCTDCHHENLIAKDDQLILVDTETLLEADLRDLISDEENRSDLQLSMEGSILRSGLLPQWLFAGGGKKIPFDISALGIKPPPPEREMPGWLGVNTDGMMAGRRLVSSELPTSLPVGLGSSESLTEHVAELCKGFTDQLQSVLQTKDVYKSELKQFTGLPRRLVARATRIYFTIQRQMLEPASLRSAFSHGLKLEQLSRSYVLASEKPINWQMFHSEIKQMENLDIPFFVHLIDSHQLPLPGGFDPIDDFMSRSGLEAAKKRIDVLNQAEINFQTQLIKGAIAARHIKQVRKSPLLADKEIISQVSISQNIDTLLDTNDFLSEAVRLTEETWQGAIQDRNGQPEWLGMDLGSDGESFTFGLIGPGLYSGTSGISLNMARLARYYKQNSDEYSAQLWSSRAWNCFEGLSKSAEKNNNNEFFRLIRDLPFGINGSGGILLTLNHLGQSGINQATELAEILVQTLRESSLLADEGIDIMAGVSGLIGPLLDQGSQRALDMAIVCGERLLSTQLESGGWFIEAGMGQPHLKPLTGFSHGAAGMASALGRLAMFSGDKRYASAASLAVNYERSVFQPDQQNWPDFRRTDQPIEFMNAWCHGAPGILLSRLSLKASGFTDDLIASEIKSATQATNAYLNRLLTVDEATHLCCGIFGITTILRIAGEENSKVSDLESKTMIKAREFGQYKLFSIDSGSLKLPGLFTGTAGIALALLEIYDGLSWLPSLLSAGLLESPVYKPSLT